LLRLFKIFKACAIKEFVNKRNKNTTKRAKEIEEEAKCSNQQYKAFKEYFDLINAGITTHNYSKLEIKAFQFCKNCFTYMKENPIFKCHYDASTKQVIKKQIKWINSDFKK